jgi:CheY-like chemotaxis protein
MKKAHVLVVDDDRDIRESFRDLLEAEGYAVSTAANGREALDFLAAHERPGLMLVDLLMPVMDGVELIETLRGDPRSLSSVPVLVVSASSTVAPPPGTPALRKPVQLDELLARVESLCHRAPVEPPAS